MMNLIKPYLIGALVILSIILIFQLLVYAIPIIFIIWAAVYVFNKIKDTFKIKDTRRVEKLEEEKFDMYKSENLFQGKVIDVEYEELNKR